MSVVRRVPQQKRSRERIEAILDGTQSLLVDMPAAELTIGQIAKRSGVPAPSIYRYFADRDAIVAAVLDQEMELLDLAIAQAFSQLQVVSLRGMFEVSLRAHIEHHRARPWLVSIWFGEPRSALIAERIRAMDHRTGVWLVTATHAAEMLAPGTPIDQIDFVIRLCDRALEYNLMSDLPADVQDRNMAMFADMAVSYLERFATPRGVKGVTMDAFIELLGAPPEHLEADD